MPLYITTFHGDLHDDPESFDSLEEALDSLVKDHHYGLWHESEEGGYWSSPDPEDDRILIWQVDPPYMRVVWHFSGWHWSPFCTDQAGGPLPQGKLKGHNKSLYDLAMESY